MKYPQTMCTKWQPRLPSRMQTAMDCHGTPSKLLFPGHCKHRPADHEYKSCFPPAVSATIPPVKYCKQNKHKPKKERGRHSPKQNSFEVDGTPTHYILNKSFKSLKQMSYCLLVSFLMLFWSALRILDNKVLYELYYLVLYCHVLLTTNAKWIMKTQAGKLHFLLPLLVLVWSKQLINCLLFDGMDLCLLNAKEWK